MDHAEDSALTSADNKLCPTLHKACALGIVARGSQLPFTTLRRIRRRKTDSLEQKRTKKKQKQKQKTMNESSQHHLLKTRKQQRLKHLARGAEELFVLQLTLQFIARTVFVRLAHKSSF